MDTTDTLRIIESAADVTDRMLTDVASCVEDWFADEQLCVDCFIDRLCKGYGNMDGWDIEQLDTPAVRKIMRQARQTKRELT